MAIRPQQLEISTGTTDNDTVTTKGYVDESGGSLNQDNIYYVGKAGKDTEHSGLNINEPVLTISKAVDLAAAQTPGSSNRFTIYVIDAGVYSVVKSIGAYISIYAPQATIVGALTLTTATRLRIYRFQGAGSANGITIGNSATDIYIEIDEVVGGGGASFDFLQIGNSANIYTNVREFTYLGKAWDIGTSTNLHFLTNRFTEGVTSTQGGGSTVYFQVANNLDDSSNTIIQNTGNDIKIKANNTIINESFSQFGGTTTDFTKISCRSYSTTLPGLGAILTISAATLGLTTATQIVRFQAWANGTSGYWYPDGNNWQTNLAAFNVRINASNVYIEVDAAATRVAGRAVKLTYWYSDTSFLV
jgi:hypothetical protein